METKVCALFVETNGVYFGLPDIDPWDVNKDAMSYEGSYPVVAHPPCQLWGAMASVNYARWGGEHNRPGNDGGCFAFALKAVERCGGVLEHPAKSRAFDFFGIKKPTGKGWKRIGVNQWVCEVWQSAYGHLANKATWLYYVGINDPVELIWDRPVGSHQIGRHDQRGKEKNKPTISGKRASRTPEAFRDVLITLARDSNYPLPPKNLGTKSIFED